MPNGSSLTYGGVDQPHIRHCHAETLINFAFPQSISIICIYLRISFINLLLLYTAIMSMSQTPSQACCNTPAVVSKGYTPKGSYITVDGMKTYATGPKDGKHALLVVYDIFGLGFEQTLQGADILANSDKTRSYEVFVPDFFDGKPADISWYPPDTPEKGEKLGAFFETTAAPPKTIPRVAKCVEELQKANPRIQSWGIIGFCWGGKIVNLTSTAGTPFKAAVAAHPAMVDPADAPNVSIPILVIPSKDEDQEAVEKYAQGLKVPHQVEWYHDQVHGFMAARGDLSDEKVKAAYEKAYKTAVAWFHEHL